MTEGLHYLDGEWVEAKDLKISAFDSGLTRGIAVFDLLRTYGQVPFRLQQHLARLRDSAAELGLTLDKSDTELEQLIEEGIAKNKLDNTIVRTMLTGGTNPDLAALRLDATLIMMFLPLKLPSSEQYEKGISLMPFRELRVIPGSKTTSYLMARRGLLAAKQGGYDDVLYVDERGQVLETTINNIFCIQGKRIITPDTTQILPGITRQAVIDAIGSAKDLILEERAISLEEAKQADEVFVTGTLTGVMSVRKIDDTELPVNGRITTQIKGLLEDLITKETIKTNNLN